MKRDGLVLAGGVAGGIAGYAAFFLMLGHGYYAPAVPGGLVGIGAGVFRSSSRVTPIVCALLALAAGYGTQWRYAGRLTDLPDVAVLMIAVGTFAGFWVPFRRRVPAPRPAPRPPDPPRLF